MFQITMGKGFHMTFANGNTISVQFGYGNYCENHFDITTRLMTRNDLYREVKCNNAEVMIWDKDNNTITDRFTDLGDGQVVGHLTADEVADLIARVAAE